MEHNPQGTGFEECSAPEEHNATGILRRDLLKTMVAGFAAVSLGPKGWAGSGQPPLTAEEPPVTDQARHQSFDQGWRFYRGDAPGAEVTGFDDSAWRAVDLPHDWSVDPLESNLESTGEGLIWGESVAPTRVGPFDFYHSQGKQATGWVVGGTGWYRKHFPARVSPDTEVEIVFDGVYMNSDVWLNGHHLGSHPYGYTSFSYDLTPYLDRQGENVVAVRVRNEGQNSRWYSGSGIYRHVWLNATGRVRVPLYGAYVTTPEVSPHAATVKVAVQIENHETTPREVTVRVRLFDSSNGLAGEKQSAHSVGAAGSTEVSQELSLREPKLWSPANPELYRAEVDLLAEGKALDHTVTQFGIRRIEVDAEHGLRINGESIKLRGGCLHHDNGLLGAAAIDRAEERRVELMKANGFNAIRTSHNPPSPAFLDACDRLGMVVIDEAFDQWELPKNPQDYHLYFKDWWQRDIRSMVRRDRNHPSVIFWSIGNEIEERANATGIALARQMIDEIKRHDPTRLITAAVPEFFEDSSQHRPWTDTDSAFQYLDVAGYNYQWQQYENDHARLPRRVMMGTESFPREAFENWQHVEKNSCVLGDFVWTGIDYLGESGIGYAELYSPEESSAAGKPPAFSSNSADYPWFNSYCGDIDVIGQPKPQLHYKHVVWGISKLEMAVQRPVPEGRNEIISHWGWSDELRTWTWPGHEGATMKVRVYSSGDKVRLLLNAREVATKPVSTATKLRADFNVPYAPGELKAIALSAGRPIAELAFRTSGKPARLRLQADRKSIRRDRNDLAYVTLEVTDEAGEVVPDASIPVTLDVTGVGELAASGTANPKDVQSFRQRQLRTFHGLCMAIIRPTGAAGTAQLNAQAEGLPPASIVLDMR